MGKVLAAPMDVVLSEANIVQPDVLFLRAERLPPSDAANIQVAPDLAVEVISPSTVTEDREYKKAVYARHGVAHYWLVDPDARTLEMYTLSGASYALAAEFAGGAAAASPLFPGLSIPLPQLWA
jgi:Uma2 family endonuclease